VWSRGRCGFRLLKGVDESAERYPTMAVAVPNPKPPGLDTQQRTERPEEVSCMMGSCLRVSAYRAFLVAVFSRPAVMLYLKGYTSSTSYVWHLYLEGTSTCMYLDHELVVVTLHQ